MIVISCNAFCGPDAPGAETGGGPEAEKGGGRVAGAGPGGPDLAAPARAGEQMKSEASLIIISIHNSFQFRR